MKNCKLIILSLVCCLMSMQSPLVRADPPSGTGNWTKTFEDNFDGSSLNASKWAINGGDTVINSPQTLNRAEQCVVNGGTLKINGLQTATTGSPRFKSALITTENKFGQQYGYFEASFKFPPGRYMWPAFWMLPTDHSWPPEIDIMEYSGSGWPNIVHLSYHFYNGSNQWDQSQGTAGSAKAYYDGGWAPDFHTYAVLWEPGKITWYIDGVQKYQTTGFVSSKPMYLLLNLAIGGAWPGNVPDGFSVQQPASMEVDWVRGWSRGDSSGSTGAIPLGQIVGLKALNNSKFISNNLNANSVLVASFATAVGDWEKFKVVDAGGGKIALQSTINNKYVSVDNSLSTKPLVARFATSIGDWEKFSWEDLGSNKFALKSNITGKYVSCDLNNGANIVASWATSPGDWEKFQY